MKERKNDLSPFSSFITFVSVLRPSQGFHSTDFPYERGRTEYWDRSQRFIGRVSIQLISPTRGDQRHQKLDLLRRPTPIFVSIQLISPTRGDPLLKSRRSTSLVSQVSIQLISPTRGDSCYLSTKIHSGLSFHSTDFPYERGRR